MMETQHNDTTMVGRIPADLPTPAPNLAERERKMMDRRQISVIVLTMMLLLSLVALVAIYPGWITFLLVSVVMTSYVLLAKVVK